MLLFPQVNRIALRLVVYICLFSSLAALFSTAVQLFFEYRRDLDQISMTVEQIRRSHIPAIVPTLWVYDLAVLTTQLQGIKNLPDVSYAGIVKERATVVETGEKSHGRHVQSHEFPLRHLHRGQELEIGILQVEVSLQGVYRRLLDRVIVILVTQMAKTFVVSIFIFFLFYATVGRHLTTMADFARSLSLKDLGRPLLLRRRESRSAEPDELGLVEAAINEMREKLIREMDMVREAQTALARSEEGFRTLVASIPGIVYRCKTQAPWRVEYISERVEQITGYLAADFLSGRMAFGHYIHPEDLSMVEAKVQAHVAAGTPFEIEYRIQHRDGGIRWVFEKGTAVYDLENRPLWLDGVILDITENRRAEERLREKDRLLHGILENTPDAVFCKDGDGRYILANSAALKAIGRPESEVVGRTDFALFPRESAEVIKRNDDQVLRDGLIVMAEEQLTVKYGETWWHTNKSPLRDGTGRIVGLVGISRDITALKLAEQQKEQLERKFLQAQKMEAIGRLAGGVAHDFNNMLNVIIGHAELALEGVDPSAPLYEDLQEIERAALRSADLTRQLLAFARKQTVAPRVLDLREAVEGMLKMLRRLIGEDIDLEWRPDKRPGLVKIDPVQIEQMLANLCVNARDAIADTGKVTIETGQATFDEAYCAEHPGFLAGEYVLLAVSDDGCGMSAETLANLFEPFYTTKELGKGTGLGLSTVYGIVKQNGGFVNVYSELGHGTTFRIYLRAQQTREKSLPPDGVEAEPVAGGGECILLVEDEPQLLKMTKMVLERKGYRVLAAAGPAEALALAAAQDGKIDLLATDVVMPGMNGRELAGRLQAANPQLRCLFMSGYTANVIAHHGVLDEGVAFIQKPVSSKDLVAKVREVLDRRTELAGAAAAGRNLG